MTNNFPTLSMTLVSDTGVSATDKITSKPAIKGVGEPNQVVIIMEGGAILWATLADATGAWSFTPGGGFAEGAHTLTASQTDPAGNTTTATLSFTLDKTAPAVSVALLDDTGSSASDGITANPAITGTGQANTLVTIKEGGITLGTAMADATGPGALPRLVWSTGRIRFSVSQTDIAGNTGTAALSFTLDSSQGNPPPQDALSIGLVSDTGVSASDRVTSNPAIKGVGRANTLVTIKEGGITLGTAMADATGAWSFTPVGLADGAHTLSASQTDPAGNTGTATLSFTLDKTAPAVSIALAADTGGSSSDKITSNPAVKGVGQANTLVTIKEGALTLGTTMADAAGAWSFTPLGLADGAHTLSASQTDLAGNTGTATLSFTLDRTAPAVSIALVSDTGARRATRSPRTRRSRGSGRPIRWSPSRRAARRSAPRRRTRPAAWSFTPIGLADGAHTLTASQTDLAGNTGTATLSFTLDSSQVNPPPPGGLTIALVSDTGGSSSDRITSNPAVKGVGRANTVVTIKEGGTTLGTTTADATGAWSFTPGGAGRRRAHAEPPARPIWPAIPGRATLSFTLDKTAPVVSMALVSDTGVSSSDRITSNPAVKGVGQANTLVTIKEGGTDARHRDGRRHRRLELHPDRPGRRRAHAERQPDRSRRQYRDGDAELHARHGRRRRSSMALASDTGSSASDKITVEPGDQGHRSGQYAGDDQGRRHDAPRHTTADATGAWSFTPIGWPTARTR